MATSNSTSDNQWFTPAISIDVGVHRGIPAARTIRLPNESSQAAALRAAERAFRTREDAISFTVEQTTTAEVRHG